MGAKKDDRGGVECVGGQETVQPEVMEFVARRPYDQHGPACSQCLGELQGDSNPGAALTRTTEPATQRGRHHDRGRCVALTKVANHRGGCARLEPCVEFEMDICLPEHWQCRTGDEHGGETAAQHGSAVERDKTPTRS